MRTPRPPWPLLLAALLAGAAGCGYTPPRSGTPTTPAGGPTATPQPVTPTPTAVPGTAATPVGNDNIRVARPRPRQEVRSPLSVSGQARVFEGTVQVELKDTRGQKLANTFTTATRGAPEWGDYTVDLPFRVSARAEATLEVFAESPRDGSRQYVVSIPVVLLPN